MTDITTQPGNPRPDVPETHWASLLSQEVSREVELWLSLCADLHQSIPDGDDGWCAVSECDVGLELDLTGGQIERRERFRRRAGAIVGSIYSTLVAFRLDSDCERLREFGVVRAVRGEGDWPLSKQVAVELCLIAEALDAYARRDAGAQATPTEPLRAAVDPDYAAPEPGESASSEPPQADSAPSDLGNAVLWRMDQLGWVAEDLASNAKRPNTDPLSPRAIRRWLNGETALRPGNRKAVADALGLSIEDVPRRMPEGRALKSPKTPVETA